MAYSFDSINSGTPPERLPTGSGEGAYDPTTATGQLAREVVEHNFWLVACEGKQPIGSKWNDPGVFKSDGKQEAVIKHVDAGGQAGIVITDLLMCFDADSEEAVAFAEQYLPQTPMKTHTSRGRRHYYFQRGAGIEVKTHPLAGADLKMNGQCVAFGAHAHGGEYLLEWPYHCTPDALPIFSAEHLEMVLGRFSNQSANLHSENAAKPPLNGDNKILEGGRDNDLIRYAGWAVARMNDAEAVERCFRHTQANHVPPLTLADCEAKVASARKMDRANSPHRYDEHGRLIIQGQDIEISFDEVDPDPEPLEAAKVSVPYPLSALPEFMKSAVFEMADNIQVDPAMAATCLLGGMSAATQGAFDVETLEGSDKPTSLFMITVAGSGERKTAVERVLMDSFYAWQDAAEERFSDRLSSNYVERLDWENEKELREKEIKNEKNPEKKQGLKDLLKDHLDKEPAQLASPDLVVQDATIQALGRVMSEGWPSRWLATSEGASIIGGHSMKANKGESAMAAQAFFNKVWDDGRASAQRASKDSASFDQKSGRLAVSLAMQPVVMDELMNDKSARLVGFVARFLISVPNNPVGKRFYKKRTPMPAVESLKKRAIEILEIGEEQLFLGSVEPFVITLTSGAESVLIDTYNDWERRLGHGGELAELADVASKSAEQAARIAGVIAGFAREDSVSRGTMLAAVAIAEYHLQTFLHLSGADQESKLIAEALLVEEAIRAKRDAGAVLVSKRDLDKGKRIWREADGNKRFFEAIRFLKEKNRVFEVKTSQTTKWRLNRDL